MTSGDVDGADDIGDAGNIDAESILSALLSIFDEIERGVAPRLILGRILDTAAKLTGASAAIFALIEANAIRVVGATSAASWMEGRRIPFAGSALAALFADTRRSRVFEMEEMEAGIQDDVAALDAGHIVLARVSGANNAFGGLALVFPDRESTLNESARLVHEFLASAIGALPVPFTRLSSRPGSFGDVDTTTDAMPDGLAIVGPDNMVLAWNAAARQLTGISSEDAVGGPVPFSVPRPGQVADHRFESGRRIEVRCSTLEPAPQRVVTFRDVTAARMDEEGRDLFLATTGHELRTPLTVVKGYADTLAERWDDLDDESRRTAVTAIRERTRELATLVDRLLQGHRTAAGAVAMERIPFDLRAALLAAVQVALGPQETLRALDLPDFLPWARGDRRSIGMIVRELITNAEKYSIAQAEINITAGADARSVYFQVADRGIGVPPDQVDAVFDRFWQADRGDQRRYGGVGLGLYIIRRLLDRQDGWVSLRPRPGGGTIVEIRLPRADQNAGPIESSANTEHGGSE